MTTEQFEKIALFMGWRKGAVVSVPSIQWWEDANGKGRADIPGRTSLTNAEACELLSVLVEKGHAPELYHATDSEGFAAWYCDPNVTGTYSVAATIPEAVSAAVLKLLVEKEGM